MDWQAAQERMIAEQITRRGIIDARVLDAMRRVPRHLFIPLVLREHAYDDRALPLGDEQTISQPYMVATMLNSLRLQGHEKVLEIGTGSGYNAALLSLLAGQVYSLEIVTKLAQDAKARLEELRCTNVTVEVRDGSIGWPEKAPFDAIVVTAGAPRVPPPLKEQLAIGGQLLVPVTQAPGREVLVQIRRSEYGFDERALGDCAFVPLKGAFGQTD
jgi:protein-L-isoaspartate(D-aspartate) O-methyltransferase